MRARSIKPGICDNELLGTADPLYTLLFERLWLMADREGRLEDRPLRIKAKAFPYREGLDVEPMLEWLAENGFIVRYVIGREGFIQVVEFKKHQKPHQNETASVIPSPSDDTVVTLVVPENNHGAKDLALTPSSLNPSSLTADSGLLTADIRAGVRVAADGARSFAGIKAIYPEGTYRQSEWLHAERDIEHHVSQGHDWAEIRAGVERYTKQCEAKGSLGTQYVLSPSKFFARGPQPQFLDPFPIPIARGAKAEKERWHPADWKPEDEPKAGTA